MDDDILNNTPTLHALLLDEPYADVLAAQAFRENRVCLDLSTHDYHKSVHGPAALSTFSYYASDVFHRWRGAALSAVTRNVLEMSVLYDKIYLPPTERFWRITRENDALPLPFANALLLGQNFQPDLRSCIIDGSITKFEGLLLGRLIKLSDKKYPPITHAIYNQIINFVKEVLNDHPGSFTFPYLNASYNFHEQQKHISQQDPLYWRVPFGIDKYPVEDWMYWFELLLWEAWHVFAHFEIAEKYQLPMFTYGLKDAVPTNIPPALVDPQAIRATVRVIFNNLFLVPRINNIEDVIRLRGDHHISAFRDKVFGLARRMQQGDISTEAEIIRDINEANEIIRDLGQFRPMRNLITGMSLPLAIVSLISGLTMTGFAMAYIGTSLWASDEIETKLAMNKYEWLMIGR